MDFNELIRIKSLSEDIVQNNYEGTNITHASPVYVTMSRSSIDGTLRGVLGDYRELEGVKYVAKLQYSNGRATFHGLVKQ